MVFCAQETKISVDVLVGKNNCSNICWKRILNLFNRKRINYYLESLVLSVHFHSFVFLFFTIILLIDLLIKQIFIYSLWIIIPPVYMVLMFMKYFERGFWISVSKTFLIGILYNVIMIVLILLTFIVSIILV